MPKQTLKELYSLIREGFGKGKKLRKKIKDKKLKVKIGLGSTPTAKAIKKHNKALEDALKY